MVALRILLILLLFTMPAFGQGESIWNVYCNEDYSRCAVAKEPSGELMFAEFSTPVTWNDAWAWMNENGYPAEPGEWNVYCNGDRSRCAVAKEPSGELMFAVYSTPVAWSEAWNWMSANGFPAQAGGAQPSEWNVYCNGDSSRCVVAKEPSGELIYVVFSTPVTWNEAWAWMSANGFPAQPAVWNVYCNGDSSRCTVAKEPSGDFMFPVFSTPVTWNEAWAWMSANGFPAQPAVWNVYCNSDRSKCAVAKEPSGDFMFSVFPTAVTWGDAWNWMNANGFPAQSAIWNVYCNGDRTKCAVAKEPSGDFMFPVFPTAVTWGDAWDWMNTVGSPAISGMTPTTPRTTTPGVTTPVTTTPGGSAGVQNSIILLFDASGSMAEDNKIDSAKTAAKNFITTTTVNDEVALIVFYDCGNIVTEQPFTQDKSVLNAKIDSIQPTGDTPLHASITFANDYMSKNAKGANQKVIMLTDGIETCE